MLWYMPVLYTIYWYSFAKTGQAAALSPVHRLPSAHPETQPGDNGIETLKPG